MVLHYPRVVSVIFTYSYSDFLDHKPLGVCSDKGLWSKKSESEYEYLLLTTLGCYIEGLSGQKCTKKKKEKNTKINEHHFNYTTLGV